MFLEKGINTERPQGETSFKNTVKYVCVCGEGARLEGQVGCGSGCWLLSVMGGWRTFFSTGVTFDYFPLHGDHLKNAINRKRCVYETIEPTT